MRVKDLIGDTVWIPGADYKGHVKPQISVLLPTFRRGKSGLFRRAVESILSQTLSDIEVIIIDDASTDGTADQIAEFQRRDGRVSCLRHPKNIGLPAISEYEAYVRARADRISFAFDDTMFNDDALEKLLSEAKKYPSAVIYGHVEWSHKDVKTGQIINMRLGAARSQGHLRISNFIPNNGVLIPRAVIEDVGFYDPHIIIARVCDWDLWCRAAERYEIKFVDVAVGREDGPMTTDSLGNTYALDSWAVDEWMRTARNEALLPRNLPEYEVLAPNPNHGSSTQTVCETLAKKHANARGWPLPARVPTTMAEAGYTLVVTLHYNASTTLYFDMLPQEAAQRLRVVSYHGGFGVEELARATCVIFVRHIEAYRPWVDAAKTLGIPAYYFLDDNLPQLVESGEVSVPGEDYSLPKLRDNLESFTGVLLSSQKLLEFFRDNLLHENLALFPVSCTDQRTLSVDYPERKEVGELVFAFAGGSHRNKGLWELIFPALKKLASEGARIHIVAPEPDDERHQDLIEQLPEDMRVTTLPFETGYLFAMRRFARFSPDFVVHAPSETINNPFKTRHALLTAKLLNAVAIVPDTPPFSEIIEIGNAVVIKDPFKPLSWLNGLKAAISGKQDLAGIKSRNSAYCIEHFSGRENAQVLGGMLSRHGGETPWPEQARRLHKLPSWVRATTGLPALGEEMSQATIQANELAALRRMTRYSWRHRILHRNSDLWNSVAPQFSPIKQYSDTMGWRKPGSSLELSDSLHTIPFREYQVTPRSGKLAAVSFVLSVDFVRHGQVGVEIVSPVNEIKDHIEVDLRKLNLDEPVRFEVSDIHVQQGETWGIRVFAKASAPVYVYEFINKRLLGFRFSNPTPFMVLDIQ